MTDSPAYGVDDEIPADLVHARNTVARELNAQLAMRGETIDLAAVCEVAHAIAVRLGREFRIERAVLEQAGLDDDESVGLDGAAFYGSVMPRDREQYAIFDYRWPAV